jgi:uncharacterized membrane protein
MRYFVVTSVLEEIEVLVVIPWLCFLYFGLQQGDVALPELMYFNFSIFQKTCLYTVDESILKVKRRK